jgi:DNA polymerase III epsilon subunit-like protein
MSGSSAACIAPLDRAVDVLASSTTTSTTTTMTVTMNGQLLPSLNPPAKSTSSELSKKDRKKLKKLKKRATTVQPEGERSGLLTRSEFDEYNTLIRMEEVATNNNNNNNNNSNSRETTDQIGPVINIRKKKEGVQKSEGVHHRDLICWILKETIIEDGHSSTNEETASSVLSPPKKRQKGQNNENPGVKNTTHDNNIGHHGSICIPHWASLHNPGAIQQLVVLEIHIPLNDIDEMEKYSQFLKSCHDNTVGLRTKWFQGHFPLSMSESLFYFTNNNKKKKTADGSSIVRPKKEDIIKSLQSLQLSEEEMISEGYPRPILTQKNVEKDTVAELMETDNVIDACDKIQSPDTIPLETAKSFVQTNGVRVHDQNEENHNLYVQTQPSNAKDSHGENSVRVLGVDCEMVMTSLGLELARVTIVQFDGFTISPNLETRSSVLLDCLVRPANQVLDYLTKHSGITAKMLNDVTTNISQVQYALAKFLTPNDILVGHSLENDLKALHYIHNSVVDTAMIFRPGHKRIKYSLRHLSGTILKKKIQTGSHCSEEDAQAALDLAVRKAWLGDELRAPGDPDKTSILYTYCPPSAVFIGPSSWLEAHVTKFPNGAHALSYESANDCKKAVMSWMNGRRKAQLMWSNLTMPTTSESNETLETFKSLVVSIRRILRD